MKKKNIKKLNESKERQRCLSLSKDCKKCGESSKYAKIYGCPIGFNDCPNTEHNQII